MASSSENISSESHEQSTYKIFFGIARKASIFAATKRRNDLRNRKVYEIKKDEDDALENESCECLVGWTDLSTYIPESEAEEEDPTLQEDFQGYHESQICGVAVLEMEQRVSQSVQEIVFPLPDVNVSRVYFTFDLRALSQMLLPELCQELNLLINLKDPNFLTLEETENYYEKLLERTKQLFNNVKNYIKIVKALRRTPSIKPKPGDRGSSFENLKVIALSSSDNISSIERRQSTFKIFFGMSRKASIFGATKRLNNLRNQRTSVIEENTLSWNDLSQNESSECVNHFPDYTMEMPESQAEEATEESVEDPTSQEDIEDYREEEDLEENQSTASESNLQNAIFTQVPRERSRMALVLPRLRTGLSSSTDLQLEGERYPEQVVRTEQLVKEFGELRNIISRQAIPIIRRRLRKKPFWKWTPFVFILIFYFLILTSPDPISFLGTYICSFMTSNINLKFCKHFPF